eukprot:TRINITY_DN8398_c0_g1::TRINITY_DN8398_c0_g1_i1::g.29064::m.29064 TRINITY_DN8398_c0_g1::TRINITY_DN8398_c0_g1_i1::g.29064  ORF type:complete len:675 (-),score=184.87,sp/A7RNG8/CCD22_NEMVE/32.40/4e-101,DUF812/PF05667.6/2.3e-126,ATG16/PF08614.6/2e+03,ATG16/PF08614.6/0.0042,ATG16/PF08614.6/3,ATG16/PF08614.6/3.1,ATG16/PF08614.6/3e+03,Tropomyosin_1/PF12718.2/3.4e+03,Tropomyosin_1/PF12718.2/7.6,Tropomyosin_1/PF12718.2/0.0076,SNARE/PF05739.14/2,SNARE/PF05739.14/37,SNARE/PF05739.14/6.1e+02,SNARE/PF05739.14
MASEVDEIIVFSLRQIGCPIPEEVRSVAAFDPELLFECVGRCLRIIKEHNGFPLRLPGAQGARFRVCTLFADTIRELGYRDQVGFQQLLYPNEKESRKLLLYLVEALPKEDSAGVEEPLDPSSALIRRLNESLMNWTRAPWCPIPRASSRHRFATSVIEVPPASKKGVSEAMWSYFENELPPVVYQPKNRVTVASSVLEHVSLGVAESRYREDQLTNSASVAQLSKEERAKKIEAVKQRLQSKFAEAGLREGSAGHDASAFGATGAGALGHDAGDAATEQGGSVFKRQALFTQEEEVAKVVTGQSVAGSEPETVALSGPAGEGGAEGSAAEKPAEPQETPEEKLKRHREEVARRRTEAAQARRDQLEALSSKVANLRRKAEQAEVEIASQTVEIKQVDEEIVALEAKATEVDQQFTVRKKVISMLTDVEGNLKMLKDIVAQSEARFNQLHAEWDMAKKPLEDELLLKTGKLAARREEAKNKLERVKAMREECKTMAQEIRDKEELYNRLQEEVTKMRKDVNRASYVRRIMDIMKNINKQRREIKRILADMHDLQKRINMQSETLHRSYAATDELIFKTAKTDAGVKPMYKTLVDLHQAFEQCGKMIEDTGRTMTSIRLFEKLIDEMDARISSKNESQMLADLKAVKKENAVLAEKVKQEGR